ncbi:MAG: sugar phosphate isomerase/epimerase family protein [Candidatus Nezhaarchaeota archaeon]|nr:sugar phosphate isomerase/epimerase family protein [Candidatus Nezhaarchaeota archaeon]
MTLIGFPLWLGDRKNIEVKVKEAVEAGFDFMELSLDYPWAVADVLTPSNIAFRVREAGLELAVHGCWRDVKLASPIEEVRKASVKHVLRTIEMAKKWDPMYVVLHISTDQAFREASEREASFVNAARKSVRSILKLASSMGLELLFENVPSQFCASLNHFRKVLKNLDHARICLDIGHAQVYAARTIKRNVNVEELVLSWFKGFGSAIRGVHVYDCLVQGKWIDEHIAPSNCSSSVRALINSARKSGIDLSFAVIEAFKDSQGRDANPKSLAEVVGNLKVSLSNQLNKP